MGGWLLSLAYGSTEVVHSCDEASQSYTHSCDFHLKASILTVCAHFEVLAGFWTLNPHLGPQVLDYSISGLQTGQLLDKGNKVNQNLSLRSRV